MEVPSHLEAWAYEVARFHKVLEQMLERICGASENHFEKRGDYHEKSLQILSLALKGIRPAFIPPGRAAEVHELNGFRHLMRHAYKLTLRSDRLLELRTAAQRLAADLPQWCAEFGEKVRGEQGWAEPSS
jgi:hypothetical protein